MYEGVDRYKDVRELLKNTSDADSKLLQISSLFPSEEFYPTETQDDHRHFLRNWEAYRESMSNYPEVAKTVEKHAQVLKPLQVFFESSHLFTFDHNIIFVGLFQTSKRKDQEGHVRNRKIHRK